MRRTVRLLRPVLLALLLASVVAVVPSAATSHAQGPPLAAQVADAPITVATFDHWFRIAVTSETPEGRRPVFPDRATKRWRHFRNQVMQFLISAEWIRGESRLQGITASQSAVLREFRKTRRESFSSLKDYRAFLKSSGMSQADVLVRVKLDLLSENLGRKITRRYKDGAARQEAVDRFVREFRVRWRAQTACAAEYRTSDCSGELPPPG